MLSKINHTQISNDFMDEFMSKLSGGAVKVFLAIARKTIGWHKDTDSISLSQLMKTTGLSRQGMINVIAELEKQDLIKVDRNDGQSNKFTINYGELVNSVDRTSQESRPVEAVTSQKSRHTKERLNKYKEIASSYLKPSVLLFDKILENDDHAFAGKDKQKTTQSWANEIRKLVEIDKRTIKDIEQVIVWCQADDFWKTNILSGEKLRKQFSRLFLQMKAKTEKHSAGPHKVNTYVPEYVPPEERAPAELVAGLREKLGIR
jgi:phage replication O-like protein O